MLRPIGLVSLFAASTALMCAFEEKHILLEPLYNWRQAQQNSKVKKEKEQLMQEAVQPFWSLLDAHRQRAQEVIRHHSLDKVPRPTNPILPVDLNNKAGITDITTSLLTALELDPSSTEVTNANKIEEFPDLKIEVVTRFLDSLNINFLERGEKSLVVELHNAPDHPNIQRCFFEDGDRLNCSSHALFIKVQPGSIGWHLMDMARNQGKDWRMTDVRYVLRMAYTISGLVNDEETLTCRVGMLGRSTLSLFRGRNLMNADDERWIRFHPTLEHQLDGMFTRTKCATAWRPS